MSVGSSMNVFSHDLVLPLINLSSSPGLVTLVPSFGEDDSVVGDLLSMMGRRNVVYSDFLVSLRDGSFRLENRLVGHCDDSKGGC